MVAAWKARCDFEEPPDLVFTFGDERVGIAVKRLWSPDQARRRLSKAAGQIGRAGIRGLVAINAQEFLPSESTVGEMQQKGEAFNRALHRLHGHLPYVAGKEHLLGLLVCGTGFSWRRSEDDHVPSAFNLTNYNQLLVLARDDAEEAFVKAFFEQQRVALQRWMQYHL